MMQNIKTYIICETYNINLQDADPLTFQFWNNVQHNIFSHNITTQFSWIYNFTLIISDLFTPLNGPYTLL